jgi:hypothetical protein
MAVKMSSQCSPGGWASATYKVMQTRKTVYEKAV